MIELARAKPGHLNFASSGHGSAAHLAGELFKTEAKVDIVHVPYKSPAPALQDVIGGHVQMMFATAASVVEPHPRPARLRALAVTTPQAHRASCRTCRPIDELGLKGFDATTWHGLVAPAGTPKEIIDVLHHSTAAALKDPAARKIMSGLGIDIVGSTPREFEAYIKAEIPKWTAVVKASGAQMRLNSARASTGISARGCSFGCSIADSASSPLDPVEIVGHAGDHAAELDRARPGRCRRRPAR